MPGNTLTEVVKLSTINSLCNATTQSSQVGGIFSANGVKLTMSANSMDAFSNLLMVLALDFFIGFGSVNLSK